ncbi:MAG: phosphotransferase [Oscillospiraceae bacterium]
MNRLNNTGGEALPEALRTLFGREITDADWESVQLQGGDVGDVKLLTGVAKSVDGDSLPFRIVHKVQKKWARPGDENSWRREYDLYASALGEVFIEALRWPKCCLAKDSGEETELWMEYIEGVSGNSLTPDMLERTALEMGHFQGKLCAEKPPVLRNISNLSAPAFLESDYTRWRSAPVYRYIRSDDCTIPTHLREMYLRLEDDLPEIMARIEKLPVVLCHRDLWLENIFFRDGEIVLIDWDTAGWGYLGEDIASLIADDVTVDHMTDYYCSFIPAYYRGLAEHIDVSGISDHCIREMILLRFGYRFVGDYFYGETEEQRAEALRGMQAVYDMKEIGI